MRKSSAFGHPRGAWAPPDRYHCPCLPIVHAFSDDTQVPMAASCCLVRLYDPGSVSLLPSLDLTTCLDKEDLETCPWALWKPQVEECMFGIIGTNTCSVGYRELAFVSCGWLVPGLL